VKAGHLHKGRRAAVRINRRQQVGVLVTLAGVAAISL
jgi:hypothetical protein